MDPVIIATIIAALIGAMGSIAAAVITVRSNRRDTEQGTATARRRKVRVWILAAGFPIVIVLIGIGIWWFASQPPLVLDRGNIFEDDFSSASSGWLNEQEANWGMHYDDGRYHMYSYEPQTTRRALIADAGTDITDAVVEVDAHLTDDDPSADSDVGIICRALDYDNYYALKINVSDRRSAIWKLKDNQWTDLGTGESNPAIHTGTATNHLRADCIGSTLTLYVNGQKVVEAQDTEFSSGLVGLQVGTGDEDPKIDVLLNDFRVSTP